jgi:hypothetical protein
MAPCPRTLCILPSPRVKIKENPKTPVHQNLNFRSRISRTHLIETRNMFRHCSAPRSISGGSRRRLPVPQHLLKGFGPLVRKAFGKLLCFLCARDPTTPHLRFGSFTRSICLDHRTSSTSATSHRRKVGVKRVKSYSSRILTSTSHA